MKKRYWWILIILLVVLPVAAWAFWPSGERIDPEVQKLLDERRPAREDWEKMTSDEREAAHRQRRERFDSLSEDQRRQFFERRRGQMMERMHRHMETRIDEWLNAPAETRTAILDKHIQEMEQRRREMQQRWAERQREGQARQGGQGGRGPEAGRREGRPGGRHGPRTQDERNQRRKERLDRTTPEQRAKFTAYHKAMQKRRKELGLPEMRGPRRRR